MNEHNFLKDIQDKRMNFKKYAQKALHNQWITKEQFDEFIFKIENDKLVIGVIGQMKAGKSTFLNALIFKDEVLPAATTPMTASLSVLTYGEEKKLEAEFYTSQEWAELKQSASLDESSYEGDNNQLSKIKVAKEIIAKSVIIENELPLLLGTKKNDVFENLIEYVGADGKYIAITKSVRIEYPMEDLKGVEIVDTPGFNDPVVSREERTKDFLKKADVVIMLLYAGRAFDATDKDIIFNKVRSVGVGKLLVGVNKYDINYAQGETETEMVANVKEQLLKACEEHSNNSIATLVKDQDPLLISANMALMSKMDLAKIGQDKDLDFYYKKALDNFEISTQAQMYEKSLMPVFEEAIHEIITKSKEEILIQKPINLIKQIGEDLLEKLIKNKTQFTNELVILNKPDTDLDELLNKTKKAKKRIDRKLNILEIEIDELVEKEIENLIDELEEFLVINKREIKSAIDEKWAYNPNLVDEFDHKLNLFKIKLKIKFNERNNKLKANLQREINYFIQEIEDAVEENLEDFDYNDYLKHFKIYFQKKIIDISYDDLIIPSDKDVNNWFQEMFFIKESIKRLLDDYFESFNLDILRQGIIEFIVNLKFNIKKKFSDDFIEIIVEKIEKLVQNKDNKELQIKDLEAKLEAININENNIKMQIEEMKVLESIF
ncbi:dynamin family protein [Flavobacterium sp. xlx-214]|uniref:dynamin family protein n=1 Tax=unclassified Flavobacterium TaxID=196869 RepID=UPI0013D09538|nr:MULTISPECIES: dynamin family protein [unclassified Flavobacterium]MBA5792336.1 dynamin family protein [Flavobacterium sp. xlx-221]QMI82349.1 dynamin family protein [Flavobacterium sp. xlx-214]